jgi:PAS domain S-box-containing protein
MMHWRFTPAAAPLLVGAGLLLLITGIAFARHRARGALAMALVSFAIGIYVVGYMLELGSLRLESVARCLAFEYVGIASVPPLLLVLVLAYTGRGGLLSPLTVATGFALPAVTCVLAFSNPSHELIWRGLRIDTSGVFTRTLFERGPWYWIQNAYAYLLIATSVALLVRELRRATGLFRRQAAVMLFGMLVPVAVHLFYLSRPAWNGLDPNPYALLITAVAFAWGMFAYGLWDIGPVAREAVLASMSAAVIVVDRRGRLAELNPAACRLLGASAEQALGRPLSEALPAAAALAAPDPPKELAVEQGGEMRRLDVVTTPLSEGGRVKGRLYLLRDVTAARRAEEQLRLQGVALESAGNGILITDRAGRILWVNPAFTRMTGYSSAEVLGRTPSLLKSGAHGEDFYRALWGTILAGQVWSGETINSRKDGSLYTEEQAIAPVRNERGEITHFIAIKQDVSSRKLAEAQREGMARTMVHDLRSPLTVILGGIELALASASLPESTREVLEAGRRNSERMLELLGAILELYRLQVGQAALERSRLAPGELVEDALRLVAPRAAAKGLRLETELPPDLPPVDADRRLMQRVLQNLLDNALKFTPAGGRIRVSARAAGTEVVLCVRDDGPGIPAKLGESVFREFVTGTLEGHGTGLGLAFCRQAVEAHGGRIWLQKVAPGTAVEFSLPAA